MNPDHINREYLDGVVAGDTVDHYYHLGLSSRDELIEHFTGLSAVVMAGSGERILAFAQTWSTLNDDAPILSVPKEDRFITRFCAGVLFVSHGMGMASASIALQEVMRLAYLVHCGDLETLAGVFWARVGTSGGIGLAPGTVVISTEALMSDLRPFRIMRGAHGEELFTSGFPEHTSAAIEALSAPGTGQRNIGVVAGRTVSTNEFFLEQCRLDGAIRFETDETKRDHLDWLAGAGVVNIEMEGAVFAAYLNHWGFADFAMVCATLLDRLAGDQVTSTPEQLQQFSDDAGEVLFRYLASRR